MHLVPKFAFVNIINSSQFHVAIVYTRVYYIISITPLILEKFFS